MSLGRPVNNRISNARIQVWAGSDSKRLLQWSDTVISLWGGGGSATE